MYSKILIPLDGSKVAEKVLPHTRYLARRFQIPVELLSVIDVGQLAAYMPAERLGLIETLIKDSSEKAERYLRVIAESFSGTDVTCTVKTGKPDELIINAAEKHAGILVAMASHGRSGLGRFLLGSVAEKVLRGTRNPLLIVRAADAGKTEGEQELSSIIVPLDGSVVSERVMPMAAELAKTLGLKVTLLSAYHIPYRGFGEDNFTPVDYGELLEAARGQARKYIDKKAAELKVLGVSADAEIRQAMPPHAIIDMAGNNPGTLALMASHGRAGVERLLLGSVTEAVVRHGRVPVLVLRPE